LNNYLLCACLKDVITTPTLLEHCGMWGSCCIEARVDIVLRLTPPRDPISAKMYAREEIIITNQWIKINPLTYYIIKCEYVSVCNFYVSNIYLSVCRTKPSHHRFPKISSVPGVYRRIQKIFYDAQVFWGRRTFDGLSVDSFSQKPIKNWVPFVKLCNARVK
jgi:hypothetical protein